ncbi:MAG: hypothetical protein MO852_17460 [Candidatus Devosia euplotis]|nr:hypothetical protein [Candidatus Devosia euplotis]
MVSARPFWPLADRFDRLPDLRVGIEGHILDGHQPAGRMLVVVDEFARVLGDLGLLRLDVVQHLLGDQGGQLLDGVHTLVRGHHRQDFRRLVRAQPSQDAALVIVVHASDDLGSQRTRRGLKECDRVLPGQILQ